MEKTTPAPAANPASTKPTEVNETQKKQGFIEMFLGGAKKGLGMWFNNMLPSIVIAALFVALIEETGLADILGNLLAPVMGIFGLPGEAAAVWIASFMNMMVGVMSAVTYAQSGVFTAEHCFIMLAMILATTPPAKYVRMASAGGADSSTLKQCIGLTVLCSIISGLLARLLLLFI